MDFATADPERLAEMIVSHIGRPVDYRDVEAGGSRRAAGLIAGVLDGT